MKIWTDDEYIEVDPNEVGQLESAMLFKAEHIKAKADPELFAAVADMLSRLWDTATKRVDVVRCRECKHLNVVNRKELYAHCPKTNTVFLPFELDTREHFCSLGERKEGADNG